MSVQRLEEIKSLMHPLIKYIDTQMGTESVELKINEWPDEHEFMTRLGITRLLGRKIIWVTGE